MFKKLKDPLEDREREERAGLGEVGRGLTIQSSVGHGEVFEFYMK